MMFCTPQKGTEICTPSGVLQNHLECVHVEGGGAPRSLTSVPLFPLLSSDRIGETDGARVLVTGHCRVHAGGILRQHTLLRRVLRRGFSEGLAQGSRKVLSRCLVRAGQEPPLDAHHPWMPGNP